jgi:hypothetical protein
LQLVRPVAAVAELDQGLRDGSRFMAGESLKMGLLYGEEDEFFEFPSPLPKWIRTGGRGFTPKTIPDCGHEWLLLRPELAAQEILALLDP